MKIILAAMIACTTATGATAGLDTIVGPKGNDTGGIIPWSPRIERVARDIAQANCARFNKHAVITSWHRRYGDYIGYVCRWNRPYWRRAYRPHRKIILKIMK